MSPIRRNLALLALLALSLPLAGCSAGVKEKEGLLLATAIEPVASIVREIAGPEAEIINLIPKGASPETYEPSPREVEEFSQADLYFSLGLPSETASLLPRVGGTLIALEEAVSAAHEDLFFHSEEEHEAEEEGTHDHGEGRDHHIWVSPVRAMTMAEEIAKALIEGDPENAEEYQENLAGYLSQLQKLDEEISLLLEDADNRSFVIFHPALGYFAADYGLEMIPLEEEGKEADPGRLMEVVGLAKEAGVQGILANDEADPRQSEAFAREIHGKVFFFNILEGDYLSMMEKMAEAVREAL